MNTEIAEQVRKTWDISKNRWLGVIALRNPCDAWEYQEIIFDYRPDIIIETGSFKGGGALFLASICDLLNHGRVISIDEINYAKPQHPRITWLTGKSLKVDIPEFFSNEKVMVILDSDHEATYVIQELERYSKFVSVGQYLIVEDTHYKQGIGGPLDAVQEFLTIHKDFEIDQSRNRFGISNNPDGFLRRIK